MGRVVLCYQAVVQVFKPASKYVSRPVVKLSPFSRVCADTVSIEDKAVVCILGAFSRFGWAVAFNAPTTSEKALEAHKSLVEQIRKLGCEEGGVREVRTGVGSEFKNVFGEAVSHSPYGKHTTTVAYAKNEAGLIERCSGTTRQLLQKVARVRGKPVGWVF